MSEQTTDGGTGGQPPSRPGFLSWGVAGVALVAFIVFMIMY
ncbi:MAG: hypothetical protein R3229_18200 [Alphaproteobacteria bacterium]|nr:hypothetical protein [Alphaproteobacteria bacterium]